MKIVYITNGMASTLNSSLELSRRLAATGHEVVYVTPADICDRVNAAGYPCRRLERDQVFVRQTPDPVAMSKPFRWIRSAVRRRAIHRRSLRNPEVEDLVTELAPDLLLIDIEMHFSIIATASLGIPTMLPIVWFTIFKRPDLPPMHTPLAPASSASGRLSIRLAWWLHRLRVIGGDWKDRIRRIWRGDIFRPVSYDALNVFDLRALARNRGFDMRSETDRSHWLRPFTYTRLPILSYTAWEMELPHERWPTLQYLGPMVLRDRTESSAETDAVQAWRTFSSHRLTDEKQQPRPLVYCSLGTYWSADRKFLRNVLDVFERRPEWDLVIGLGGKLDPSELAPVPANALVVDYAPQLEILEQADCAITHGGITTINECVEFGVPMVAYSTRHIDQDGCAARLAFHGLGVVGNPDRVHPGAIQGDIEQALVDPVIRSNIEDMQAHFDRYRDPDAAVEAIEAFVDKPRATGHFQPGHP